MQIDHAAATAHMNQIFKSQDEIKNELVYFYLSPHERFGDEVLTLQISNSKPAAQLVSLHRHQRRDQHKCELYVRGWNTILSNCQDKARDWPLPPTIFSQTTHTWAGFEIYPHSGTEMDHEEAGRRLFSVTKQNKC